MNHWKKISIFFFTLLLVFSMSFQIATPSLAQPHDEKLLLDPKWKTPVFIDENWQGAKNEHKQQVLWSYLKAKKQLFQIQDTVQSHFRIFKTIQDKQNRTHFRLQQLHQGIEVFGADQTVHLNPQNQVTAYFGQYIPSLDKQDIPTQPTLSQAKALEIAKKELSISSFAYKPKVKLWIYPHEKEYQLAYEIKVSTVTPQPSYWHVYVNATNGKVIEKFDAIQHAKGNGKGVFGNEKSFEIRCEDSGSPCYLDDQTRGNGIQTHDAQNQQDQLPGKLISSQTKTFDDPAGVDAHVYAAQVYDYFKDHWNRNSFDDQGAVITSSVHVGDNWNNAAWNGEQMMYDD